MDQSLFTYDIVAEDPTTHARAGVLHTPHGDVPTPIFMPVGTKATVKGLLPSTLEQLGTKILLANTYHLSMRPGADLVAEMGGLHDFMGWHHPILHKTARRRRDAGPNRRKGLFSPATTRRSRSR